METLFENGLNSLKESTNYRIFSSNRVSGMEFLQYEIALPKKGFKNLLKRKNKSIWKFVPHVYTTTFTHIDHNTKYNGPLYNLDQHLYYYLNSANCEDDHVSIYEFKDHYPNINEYFDYLNSRKNKFEELINENAITEYRIIARESYLPDETYLQFKIENTENDWRHVPHYTSFLKRRFKEKDCYSTDETIASRIIKCACGHEENSIFLKFCQKYPDIKEYLEKFNELSDKHREELEKTNQKFEKSLFD